MSLTTISPSDLTSTIVLASSIHELPYNSTLDSKSINSPRVAAVENSNFGSSLLGIVESHVVELVEIDDEIKNKLSVLKKSTVQSTRNVIKNLNKKGKNSLRSILKVSETHNNKVDITEYDDEIDESTLSDNPVNTLSSSFDKIKYPSFLFTLGASSFFETINQGVTVADCLGFAVTAFTTFTLTTWTIPAFIACLGGNVLNGLLLFFSIFVVIALLGNIALDYGLDPSLIGLSGNNYSHRKRSYFMFGQDDFNEVLANFDQIVNSSPITSFSLKKYPIIVSSAASIDPVKRDSALAKHIFHLKLGSFLGCLANFNNILIGICRNSASSIEFRMLIHPKETNTIYSKMFAKDNEIEDFMIIVDIDLAKLVTNSRNFMFDKTIPYAVNETFKLVKSACRDALYDVIHFRFMKKFQPLAYLSKISEILSDYDESIHAETRSAAGLTLY